MNDEIWVLGATGRTGRQIAMKVRDAGFRPVLVGRDRSRLESVAAELGRGDAGVTPRIVAGSLTETLVELASSDAAAVISTVGPFVDTAPAVIAALPPGTHYIDINNEIDAIEYAFSRHDESVAAGRTLVSAAGYGVLAIEGLVLHLCADQPQATRVRVDAFPSVGTEPGLLGAALAGTIIDGFRAGGRRVLGGQYVKDHPASAPASLTTPDGFTMSTGSFPSGDLLTAWRASGAPEVLSASTAMGLGPIGRAAIPPISGIMRSAGLRRFATKRLASMKLKGGEKARPFSWSHARIERIDGTVREGWLRVGDGMDFTTDAAATVATRLVRGEGKPGAYTPGQLFGPSLTTSLGGHFLLVE